MDKISKFLAELDQYVENERHIERVRLRKMDNRNEEILLRLANQRLRLINELLDLAGLNDS